MNDIRLNSPYDPDSTLGNAAAQGFDYFRDYYNEYIVTKSKWKVRFMNESPYNYVNCYVWPEQGGSVPSVNNVTKVEVLKNTPNMKWACAGPITGKKSVATVKGSWSINRDRGVGPRALFWEGSSYSAGVAANPTTTRSLYMWLGMATETGDTGSIKYHVEVTVKYWVKFYSRKNGPENVDPD